MNTDFYYIKAITANGVESYDAKPYLSSQEALQEARKRYEKNPSAYKDIWVEDRNGARILAVVSGSM